MGRRLLISRKTAIFTEWDSLDRLQERRGITSRLMWYVLTLAKISLGLAVRLCFAFGTFLASLSPAVSVYHNPLPIGPLFTKATEILVEFAATNNVDTCFHRTARRLRTVQLLLH